MDREFVKNQLLKLGYAPEFVTDDMVDEFLLKLEEDDDFPVSPSKPKTSAKKVPSPSPSPKAKSKVRSPVRKVADPRPAPAELEYTDDEEYSEEAAPPPVKTVSAHRSPLKSPRKVHDDDDDEITNWSKRIRDIQKRAKGLDSQIQECRSAIMDPPTDDIEVDIPLYYGTAERKLDPYPTVKKKQSGGGGFIRPPPVRASRKPAGPNKAKGRRLLYEERFPPYVPGPEKRRDALRWQIRQKLEYSDPRYHQ